jgi:hypothetical protein
MWFSGSVTYPSTAEFDQACVVLQEFSGERVLAKAFVADAKRLSMSVSIQAALPWHCWDAMVGLLMALATRADAGGFQGRLDSGASTVSEEVIPPAMRRRVTPQQHRQNAEPKLVTQYRVLLQCGEASAVVQHLNLHLLRLKCSTSRPVNGSDLWVFLGYPDSGYPDLVLSPDRSGCHVDVQLWSPGESRGAKVMRKLRAGLKTFPSPLTLVRQLAEPP